MDKDNIKYSDSCVDEIDKIIDSELFKTLGEPVRCQILKFLALNGPSDVGTVSGSFSQDRSVISRHLQLMHECGLLTLEKQSRRAIYMINGRELLAKLEGIVAGIRAMVEECENT